MVLNPYTGKEETRKKVVFENIKPEIVWDRDLTIPVPKLPTFGLPVTFTNKKIKITVEIVE
jgi:hypothetical protein